MSTITCKECDSNTKVVDGRPFKKSFRRRRVCTGPDSHNFHTLEIPAEAPQQIIETIQWMCEDHISQEDIDYMIYTVRKSVLGLKDESDED